MSLFFLYIELRKSSYVTSKTSVSPCGFFKPGLQLDTGLWISCIVIKAFYFVAHCVPNKPDFSQLPFRYQRAIRRQGARISDDEDDDTDHADEIESFNDRSLLLGESLTASYRARPRPRNLSPETACSLWSWITFSWPYRLLHQVGNIGFLKISQFPDRILMEHIDMKNSLDFELEIECSIGILYIN